MELHQTILEVLDRPLDFEVTENKKNWFEAEFRVQPGLRLIVFQADPIDTQAQRENEEEDGIEEQDRTPVSWEVIFKQPSAGAGAFNLTKRGGELQIFATIKAILERLFKERPDIQRVHFTADKNEKSRGSLYAKFLKRYMPKGFKASEDHKSSDYRSYFSIERVI